VNGENSVIAVYYEYYIMALRCMFVVENGCAAKVRGGRVVKQYDIVSDMRFRVRPPTKIL